MAEHERVVIDTNLLVRYLTQDDPQKAKAVDKLLNQAMAGELRILVPSIVIAELIWVLESFYKMKQGAIVELIEAIFSTPGLDVTDKPLITSAINNYRDKNIDFIDAWIVEFAKDRGIQTVYTYDKKHFKNIEGLNIRHP